MSHEAIMSLIRVVELNGYTVTLAFVLVLPKLVTAICNGVSTLMLAKHGIAKGADNAKS